VSDISTARQLVALLDGLHGSTPAQQDTLERAALLAAQLVAEEAGPDVRKSVSALYHELDDARPYDRKTFLHIKRDEYQLLFVAFDERTNDAMAVFSMCTLPRLKFTMPLPKFLARFEVVQH